MSANSPEAAPAGAEAGPPFTGGCLCGAVRFETADRPAGRHFCHCRMCRLATGSAFALFGSVARDRVAWTRGRPRFHRSSPFAERGFCGECGTSLSFAYVSGDTIGLSLAAFDRPELLPPERHDGVEGMLPWLYFADGLPHSRTEDDPEYLATLRAHGLTPDDLGSAGIAAEHEAGGGTGDVATGRPPRP